MMEEREKSLQSYEAPTVGLIYWSADVITMSTDAGEEYPDDWN